MKSHPLQALIDFKLIPHPSNLGTRPAGWSGPWRPYEAFYSLRNFAFSFHGASTPGASITSSLFGMTTDHVGVSKRTEAPRWG